MFLCCTLLLLGSESLNLLQGAAATTAVEAHGRLKVSGNQIVGEHGQPVRLRGMSMFWSQWMGQFWNKDAIDWLVIDWKVTLIRAAMGVDPDGYLANQEGEKAKLSAVVGAAIDNGIYVVIDWHDYEANTRIDQAKAFFSEMSQKYGQFPNVLFETFNEPQQIGWSDTIKPYHEQIVPVIREHSSNIIICGTRTWSQEVDEASQDPVPGDNIAYTIHFYAASMGQDLRDKVSRALGNGAAIFATEWGTCEYTGDGSLNLGEAQRWLDFFEENHISDANWAVSDKRESCAALVEGAGGGGGWGEDQLTQSGKWVRGSLRSMPEPSAPAGSTGGADDGGVSSAGSSGGGRMDKCPGSFDVPGYGKVELIPTGWGDPRGPPPQIELHEGGTLKANINARAYFGDECTDGEYDHKQYMALNLLGRTLRYTTDVSDSGCGCNAAVYLVSMHQNEEEGSCGGDFYCDANKVCGVNCPEIDIQESNMYAWHSTLHSAFDSGGVGGGYGGGDGWDGPRDFGSSDYGPGARCIDTNRPFQVAASFPAGRDGSLRGVEVELSQKGCSLKVAITNYEGMDDLGQALGSGVTPVVSYWSSDEMLWMDGKGADGQGPCQSDDKGACSSSVKFYDFCVSRIGRECGDLGSTSGPLPTPAPGFHALLETAPGEAKLAPGSFCPGTIALEGYGNVSLTNAKWNDVGVFAGDVEVSSGKVVPHMKGRTYFAKRCSGGKYDSGDYLALNLLGKSMRYTVDLSGAGCGCKAALYLVSMAQNQGESNCEDFYCDANGVCGASCAEIDIQEANQRAWHSTLHAAADAGGADGGYGGGVDWDGPRDWDASQYGPGASCIDTKEPFQVTVSFPVDSQGSMKSLDLTLSQEGKDCPLKVSLGAYAGMSELSDALSAGMTPVISYWSTRDLGWMDGEGSDGNGPCGVDKASECGDTVKFYDFSVFKVSSSIKEEGGDSHKDDGSLEASSDQPASTLDSTEPPDTMPSEKPPQNSCVARYGILRADGNRIVGSDGEPVRLRGMSLFWSQWMGQFWNRDTIRWLARDWHVTVIRAAMGVDKGGYLENPSKELAKLDAVIRACIEVGIYVIVDWHDYNAHQHVDDAKGFFSKMSQTWGAYPNVLFETYDEPQDAGWSDTIKPYHEQMVPVIRRHSDNLIILGTRTWSQEVDEASRDPVQGENLAYTVHFYAASMGQQMREKVASALDNGVPIFATEWGTCEYTGNGQLNLDEAKVWLDFLKEHGISDANWAVGDKEESCSALRKGASGKGGWKSSDITESGAFVRSSLRSEPVDFSGSLAEASAGPPTSAPHVSPPTQPPKEPSSPPPTEPPAPPPSERLTPQPTANSAKVQNVNSTQSAAEPECPGTFELGGYGSVSVVPTGWGRESPPPEFKVAGGVLQPHMGTRAYFADSCTPGKYSNSDYLALKLMGKTLRYITDMSGAGCGCNAAMYLVSMHQNDKPSICNDYYCDANEVCGVACTEIDIQEGNQYAWHSTVHSGSDNDGVGGGYGGGNSWNGPRDFTGEQFAPGGKCVDTSEPFEVAVSFPTDSAGELQGMYVTLSQTGHDCFLDIQVAEYDGMDDLSKALTAGMTPVISYWSNGQMLWMDGKGNDSLGPCKQDVPDACAASVNFANFSVQPISDVDLARFTTTASPTAAPTQSAIAAPTIRSTTAAPLAVASTESSTTAPSTTRSTTAAPLAVASTERSTTAPSTTRPTTAAPVAVASTESSTTAPSTTRTIVTTDKDPAPPPTTTLAIAPMEDVGGAASASVASCAGIGVDCRASRCCESPGHQCYEKDTFWATCKEGCTPGIDLYDPKEFRSPWSCKTLGERAPGQAVHKGVAATAVDADDEVVVRLRQPGASPQWRFRMRRSDVPDEWVEGGDVTLRAGERTLRGQVLTMSDTAAWGRKASSSVRMSITSWILAGLLAVVVLASFAAIVYWREQAYSYTQALAIAGVLQVSSPRAGGACAAGASTASAPAASAWAMTCSSAAEALGRWLPGAAGGSTQLGSPGRGLQAAASPGPLSPGAGVSPGARPSPGHRKLLSKEQ